jgi:hypothetical protein
MALVYWQFRPGVGGNGFSHDSVPGFGINTFSKAHPEQSMYPVLNRLQKLR